MAKDKKSIVVDGITYVPESESTPAKSLKGMEYKIVDLEKLEHELASNSYIASHHEENEMVIKTSRVIEIIAEHRPRRSK